MHFSAFEQTDTSNGRLKIAFISTELLMQAEISTPIWIGTFSFFEIFSTPPNSTEHYRTEMHRLRVTAPCSSQRLPHVPRHSAFEHKHLST